MIETGMILIWSGALEDIPDGYVLCDGTAGTPDLRSRFIRGAWGALAPGTTGGSAQHNHSILLEDVGLADGEILEDVAPTGDFDAATVGHDHGGLTGNQLNIPPYYALAFIMKT